eukprot:1047991-Rhodomonas_salina.4
MPDTSTATPGTSVAYVSTATPCTSVAYVSTTTPGTSLAYVSTTTPGTSLAYVSTTTSGTSLAYVSTTTSGTSVAYVRTTQGPEEYASNPHRTAASHMPAPNMAQPTSVHHTSVPDRAQRGYSRRGELARVPALPSFVSYCHCAVVRFSQYDPSS